MTDMTGMTGMTGTIEVDVALERPGFSLKVAFRTDESTLGIFGPSGAGKSTILAIMAGLVRPDRGVVRVGGRTLFDSDRKIDVPMHQRRVGMVFQDLRLFPHLTVSGNLRYGPNARRDDHADLIEILQLGPLLQRTVAGLSGGEQQRVAIGRALLIRPDIVLLDEPTGSLDGRLRAEILEYLGRIHRATGRPMIQVSHRVGDLLELAEELLVIDQGRVVGHGRYGDLLQNSKTLPTLRGRGIVNRLRGRSRRGATTVDVAGTTMELVTPVKASGEGLEIMIEFDPADVALARDHVVGTSICNQIEGTVVRWTDDGAGVFVEVRLGVRGPSLVAEIGPESLDALDIGEGSRIVCLLKRQAIRIS